jgi:hypothetical protein
MGEHCARFRGETAVLHALGHENVLTKFASYGQLTPPRQAELIRELGKPKSEAVDQPGQNWALGFDYPLAGVTAFCGVGQCFFGHMTRTCCPHLDKEYLFFPQLP